jgi:serine/threonine protein kinase/Tfp pilus assembly protein PilF
MDSARYAKIRSVLLKARQLGLAERPAFLERACRGDDDLRREVEELLSHDSAPPGFLRTGGVLEAVGLDAFDSPDDAEDEPPPPRIGRYLIGEELGRGGMGVVYRAEQAEPLRRDVALKLIKRGMDTDAVIARFQAERQTLALMDHPNIASVLDAGATDDGRPYFVMELVLGERITTFCDEHTLAAPARLDLFLEVCRAVQHAHQRGIVHRDLKPSNVMAFSTDEGTRIKVIDFGIAKTIEEPLPGHTLMTRAGQLLGTPEYMSPEQAGIVNHPVDTRTDVYSLGAVLYELLSGRQPYHFARYTFEEIQRTFREHDPLRPSTAISDDGGPDREPTDASTSDEIGRRRGSTVDRLRRELSGDLDNIVLMAMHKDPERRYPSVDALAEDIRRHRTGRPVHARADSWQYRSSKFVRRNILPVSLATVALAFLLGFSIYTAVQSARIARERDRAVRAEAEAKIQAERAQSEAATAREISDFLVSLFEVSDPGESRGREITAREILEQGAARIDEELTGQPVVRARLLFSIGEVNQKLGLYDAAREQLDEALRIRRAELGDKHPEVAESLVQRAWLYRDTGHALESLPLLQEALAIQRAAYGEEHVAINTTLYHQASAYEDLGEFEKAIDLYRRILALDQKLLPEDDPQLGESMNNLAVALSGWGEYDEAESLYRESLAYNRRVLGEDHPEVATSMANLSNLLFTNFDREEGLAMAKEAFEIRRRVLGEEHPHTAIAAGNLGIKYYSVGRHAEAEQLLRSSLATKQKAQGERHPSTAHAWILLGLSQLGQENFAAAEASFGTSVDIYREAMPEGHNSTARALEGLGRALMGQGRLDEAEPLFLEALAIRREALSPGHRELCDSLTRLGQLRTRQGALTEAEPLFLEAYAALLENFGSDDDRTRSAASELVELYRARGDAERVAAYEALTASGKQ